MIKDERIKSFAPAPPGWTATFRLEPSKGGEFTVPVVGWAVLEIFFDSHPDEPDTRLSLAVLLEPDRVALVDSVLENGSEHELHGALVSIQWATPDEIPQPARALVAVGRR